MRQAEEKRTGAGAEEEAKAKAELNGARSKVPARAQRSLGTHLLLLDLRFFKMQFAPWSRSALPRDQLTHRLDLFMQTRAVDRM